MKRLWKEIVIICCFVGIYCLLIFEHEQHIGNVVIKELPYIIILIVSIVFVLWSIDKLKTYQVSTRLQHKMKDISDRYNLQYDDTKTALSSCENILNQLNQKLKNNELNISDYEYRYRKVADLTGQIVFEYNLMNNTICDSLNWHALGDGNRFIEGSIRKGNVHPEDAEIFRTFFTTPSIVGTISEITIRMKEANDTTYYVTKIRGIVLEGLNGEPEKIIGIRTKEEKA